MAKGRYSSGGQKPPPENYFPSLPEYKPPTTGFLAQIHPSLHPYLQLMRLDRPKPSIYFYLPHLVGSLQASILLQTSVRQFVQANIYLLAGTFFLRGSTCTWNDIVDVEFDKCVERTRHRALARGAISLRAASVLMIVQAVCAAGLLSFMPSACTVYALPGVAGWFLYPLAKRVTNYPQVVLGFPMAWGVFMGAAAVGAEPLRIHSSSFDILRGMSNSPMQSKSTQAILYVYCANALWTLCYETVYSYQDIRDDAAAGVKNIALLLRDRAKVFLMLISAAEIVCLYAAGKLMNTSWLYMTFAVVLKALLLLVKIVWVDLTKPADCRWWFMNGGYIIGGTLVAGLALEYMRQGTKRV